MEHDASKHLVYISGEMFPPDQAKISVFDTAVTLGDTVTESTRTFGHRPFKLERHIERLYRSLKVSRINAGMSPAEMTAITLEVLETNLPHVPPHEDVWIVHNISRGMGAAAADPTLQRSPATIIINTAPMILRDWAVFFTEGCHAVTPFSRAIPTQSLDARIKNRSRLAYTLAEAEVKLVDPQAQSVILDTDGNVDREQGRQLLHLGRRRPQDAPCPRRPRRHLPRDRPRTRRRRMASPRRSPTSSPTTSTPPTRPSSPARPTASCRRQSSTAYP